MILHDALANWVVKYLTTERPGHSRRTPLDMERFKRAIRPGDVVLVEGKARISQVIMYLTQSSWSHAFLYLGDALLRWGGPEAALAVERFGAEAAFLGIESDMRDGVRVVPVAWYAEHNLRLCRPHGLKPEDRDRVLAEALKHLGVRYDKRNIFDLGRYLTPFHLLPARWRRKPLYLGSSTSREIICSALLAKSFYKVNYPITPVRAPENGQRRRWAVRHPSYIMPRDFDLSPNFEILKVHMGEEREFGYGEA